jgi:hypothetical protein
MRCQTCGSTARWCDCAIAKMSPRERLAKQAEILAVYLAALDRREFERRQLAQPMKRVRRGEFGNAKSVGMRKAG